MKRIIIMLLISSIPINLFCAFEDYGWGTRSMGLGGAYVALSDDSSGVFHNPAGISTMKNAEVSFMYAGLLTGLDMESLGIMQTGGVYHFQKIGSTAVNWSRFKASNLYTEDTVVLTYANNINQLIHTMDDNIYIGANIKMFHSHYQLYEGIQDDPVFANGDTQNAFGIDLGCLVKFDSHNADDYNSLGISVFNINQPDIGLKQRDVIPLQIKGGFSYPLSVRNNFFKSIHVNRSITLISISYININDVNVHFGWENWFFKDLLSFRMGGNLNELGGGMGLKYSLKKPFEIHFNYAFLYPLKVRDTYGSHRASLSMRF